MAVLNFDIKTVNLPTGEEAKAVFLTGSIDASTNQTFEGRLTDILAGGTRNVLLVLTNVKYINSTGLGTIVKCVDHFREKNGDVKLVGVPTKVVALFEMLGLLALFEIHDTIEVAVESFAKKGGKTAAPAVTFPIQFKHPVTGLGLNVSQPGRFKDPRSGDYFSVDANGTIEFYEISKVTMAEVRVSCDFDFSAGIAALADGVVAKVGLASPVVAEQIQQAVAQLCTLVRGRAGEAGEACTVLIVADHEKLQVGLVGQGAAVSFKPEDAVLKPVQALVDEIKFHALPARGNLLTLLKRWK